MADELISFDNDLLSRLYVLLVVVVFPLIFLFFFPNNRLAFCVLTRNYFIPCTCVFNETSVSKNMIVTYAALGIHICDHITNLFNVDSVVLTPARVQRVKSLSLVLFFHCLHSPSKVNFSAISYTTAAAAVYKQSSCCLRFVSLNNQFHSFAAHWIDLTFSVYISSDSCSNNDIKNAFIIQLW